MIVKTRTARRLPGLLAERNVSGAAVYDAFVALAAVENKCVLATRGGRALATYERMGADVEFVS